MLGGIWIGVLVSFGVSVSVRFELTCWLGLEDKLEYWVGGFGFGMVVGFWIRMLFGI